jgi:cobalt/nickel transport system permease protein
MHIPDGFLSAGVIAGCWAASVAGVGYAARRASGSLGEREVPLLPVMGAFIFAAQMLNFRVTGGTSGHLLGGALAAIVLGPWPATLVLSAVLLVQALVFQDGGLLALGANVLNMAVVGVLVGYAVYAALRWPLGSGKVGLPVRAFLAAWVSVVTAALLTAVELALSGAFSLGVALAAMGSVHALIGVGEGIITALVVGFLRATRPDLVRSAEAAA